MRGRLRLPPQIGRTHLSVIGLGSGEQSVQGVVAGDDESSNVNEELAGNVEEDEEEVEAGETEDSVGLGDRGLLLEVVEGGVLGKLDNTAVSEEHSAMRKRSKQSVARVTSIMQAVPARGVRQGDLCMRMRTREGIYLLVELRQVRLGSILDRHDGYIAGEELEVGCVGAVAEA
jgi:hypothetical protein